MLNIYPETTRVDFEIQGANVLVSQFTKGWQEGYMTDLCSYQVGVGIAALLYECEKAGFTCEMCDSLHGRALRGEITRIDFVTLNGERKIRKYPFGWTAKTRPLEEYLLSADDWQAAVQWCKDRGWNVREWPDGARAFKGPLLPVRDSRAILSMRRQVEQNMRSGHADGRWNFDLAFDF